MGTENTEVVNETPQAIFRVDAGMRAEVDLQVATAKAYPRNLRRVMNGATSMATASQEIAEGCIYSYRRGGKDITGPSVRLAEIMANEWGNLRCQTRLGEETSDSVTAIGTVWDLERNVLVQSECRRSIRGSRGDRYTPDMIAVTANAAASIALRNAVFRVVPRAIVEEVYGSARAAAVGDLKSLAERRGKALASFGSMGVSADRVLARLGISDEREITLDHLAVLTAIRTSLRDGEVMLEEEFPEPDDAKPNAAATSGSTSGATGQKAAPPASRMDGLADRVRGNGKPPAATVRVTKPKPGDVPHDVTPPTDDIPPPGGADGVIPGA